MSGSAEGIGLPPAEAIAFFRRKLNVGTETFRDLQREQHAVAFTVAGAMGADLLADVRGAVDKAIAGGGTLGEFRAEFDQIVQRHGWRHRGKPGWRARVIFETNLRTAYAAGAWRQIQQTKAERPYLRYAAILDQRTRPLHRRWHGTIRPVDDAFWRTHYPPNGWRCRCSVITLDADQLREMGWQVTDPPPPSGGVPTRVRQADGTDRIESVPPGVDPAFAYNVGEANLRWQAAVVANEKLAAMPPDMAAAVWRHVAQAAERARAGRANFDDSPGMPLRSLSAAARFEDAAAEYRDWARRQLAGAGPTGETRVVGALSPAVIEALTAMAATDPGVAAPASAAVGVTSSAIHRMAGAQRAPGRALATEDLLRLPEIVARPEAVLLKRRTGAILLVFTPPGADPRAGKIVVELDYATRDERRRRQVFNAAKSAGLVARETLADPGAYVVLDGAVR